MFYRPERGKRYFCHGVLYKDINWKQFGDVVDHFKQRVEDWYLKPGNVLKQNAWVNSFSLMAINCLLIDALSQFEAGTKKSSESQFKKFVSSRLPEFAKPLPEPIRIPFGMDLKTFADVLYVGFRCGIVHEAHVAMYGGLATLDGKLCDIDTEINTKYADGQNCPTVRMDPVAIFKSIREIFHTYIRELTNSQKKYNQLRVKFKKKFKHSFGIDLQNSIL